MRHTLLHLGWFGEGATAEDGPAEGVVNGGGQAHAGDGGKAAPEREAGQLPSTAGAAPAKTDGHETADAPEEQPGERKGQTPAEADFREVLAKAALAARIKSARATADRWEKEAEDLKQIYPFFSLEQSMRSDRGFVSLLRAGVPVKLAFEAANLKKILGAAMRYAAGTAGKRTVQSILAGGSRVRENPVLDRAASVRKKDVGSLTDREIMKILKQVSNGEKVTF